MHRRWGPACTAFVALVTITGCGADSKTQKSLPTSTVGTVGNVPEPISQAILRMEDLPGEWALEDMAPDAASAETDPSAQELNRCLNVPLSAQPQRDRSSFSMFFAQTPKLEHSVIVNSAATLVVDPSEAMDNVKVHRGSRIEECYEPSIKQNAIKQYQILGYDVRDAAVNVDALDTFQSRDDTYAFRSTIVVSLNDGRTMTYYIDSFGVAANPVYSTLTVYRDGEPPPEDMERRMLDKLRERASSAARKLT